MHSRLNYLALAGFLLSLVSFLLTVLASLCILSVLFTPTAGAILGIAALVSSSVGLTMTGIARSEIVQNAQFGDEFAVSGMVVGIIVCTLTLVTLTLYFILFT